MLKRNFGFLSVLNDVNASSLLRPFAPHLLHSLGHELLLLGQMEQLDALQQVAFDRGSSMTPQSLEFARVFSFLEAAKIHEVVIDENRPRIPLVA